MDAAPDAPFYDENYEDENYEYENAPPGALGLADDLPSPMASWYALAGAGVVIWCTVVATGCQVIAALWPR